MEEMNRQMQWFVDYVRTEMLSRMQQQQDPGSGLVPLRRPMVVPVKVVSVKTASVKVGSARAAKTGKKK